MYLKTWFLISLPFFLQCLDVVPKEENKAFLAFNIPHDREARLTLDTSFIFCLVYLILITAVTF